MSLLAQEPTLADFGRDVWWLVVAKIVLAFVFGLVMTLLGVWFERKVVAWMQVRPGPNQVGPFGLLQTLADGLKMALKEDILPRRADKVVFFFAPTISAICAVTALSVIPFGPMVSVFGHRTPLQVTDVPVAVLVLLAASSMGIYGIVLGGWASGSTYPLLGGLRSAAQMVSYEVAMGLSIVAVFMTAGSMSTSEIVARQAGGSPVDILGWEITAPSWYVVLLLPSFLIYFISAVGETNRAPFDLPEAESELVAGYMTEYSSLKFALYMLAEYINMVTVSAVATTLFLGGWRAPAPITTIWGGANSGWWPFLWFFAKVVILIFVFVWLRGTLPRLRYDQFMRFGWKVLLPVNLVWIMAVAWVRVTEGWDSNSRRLAIGVPVSLVVIGALLWPARRVPPPPDLQADVDARPPGSFPLPPMDLQVPPSPQARRLVAARTPANVGAGTAADDATTAGPDEES